VQAREAQPWAASRVRPPVREQDLTILRTILATRGGFTHRQHLELAWSYLRIHEPEEAQRAMGAAIRHVARLHGAPDRYHETITRSWVRLVALHLAGSEAESFDEFIADNPALLDRHLLGRHYSPGRLSSPHARRQWTEPDLRDFPRAT